MSQPVVPPDADVLAAQLAEVSKKSMKDVGYAVYSADGTALVASSDKGMVPASTMKVLTAMAAVDVLGAATTYSTSVVSAKRGKITLVGGGDPFLTVKKSTVPAKPANLNALVAATAKALKAQKVKKVALTYDASLFSGSSYSSSWKKEWASYTPRIKALLVNSGKSTGWRADADPAKAAAKLFASKLVKKGVKVTSVKSAKAPKGATALATQTSATVGTMVRRMLRYSDNVAAEVLARQVALAQGRPGSFSGASAALTAWLKEHQLWASGMRIDGGCGLSSKTKLRPSVLNLALVQALDDVRFLDVTAGLPVAGVDGTLKKRFNDKQEAEGRKVVHAKTGSLKEVSALAGYVTTKDGALLTFAFMASHPSSQSKAASNWLDRSATVLAKCGCS
jgi:D-alanyl-D-alanine carboxypeptidase/D-alanyl-D-alanine-endopeptidase (penicillin-binding protein 4)